MSTKTKSKVSALPKVYPSQARQILIHSMACNVPVFVWGSPGIGKSDLIAAIAHDQGRQLIDLRMLLLDPTDVKGIPYYNTDTQTMEWAKPSELPEIVSQSSVDELEKELARISELKPANLVEDEAHTNRVNRLISKIERTKKVLQFQTAILFLDELNAAPPSVQAAAYQLVLNRRVGEYELPAGVSIIAAGNKETDKGHSYRMPTPLANRFTHIEMQVNVDDWVDWAIGKNVYAEVIGFIKQHNHRLYTFDPESPDRAFATPRSWHRVSDLLSESNLTEDLNTVLVAGTVGEGTAIEFMQHRRFAEKLPSPIDVLSGRATTLEVTEISAMYTLSISVCYQIKNNMEKMKSAGDQAADVNRFYKEIDCFFNFIMKNFNTEVAVLAARTLMRDFKVKLDITKMTTFDEFHDRYGKYIVSKR